MENKLVFDMFEDGKSYSVNVHLNDTLIGTYDLKEFMTELNQGAVQVMRRDEVESISVEVESKEYDDGKTAA